MKMLDLWENSQHMSPAEQQEWLRASISRRLAESSAQGTWSDREVRNRIVLGIAEYAREDLEFADLAHVAAQALGLRLELFLLTACSSQAEIEGYVPGVGPVFQSPVVGIWKEGVLIACGSGFAAREIITGLRAARHPRMPV